MKYINKLILNSISTYIIYAGVGPNPFNMNIDYTKVFYNSTDISPECPCNIHFTFSYRLIVDNKFIICTLKTFINSICPSIHPFIPCYQIDRGGCHA